MRSFHPPDDIHEIARALSPEPVRAIAELRKGNNSRIFQVDTRAGRYALKKYPATDNRNRLEAEVGALRFFERNGVGRTPRIVAVSPELRYALFTWIDGDPVEAVTDTDIAEFAAFQIALDAAVDAPGEGGDRRGLRSLPLRPAHHVPHRAPLCQARRGQA